MGARTDKIQALYRLQSQLSEQAHRRELSQIEEAAKAKVDAQVSAYESLVQLSGDDESIERLRHQQALERIRELAAAGGDAVREEAALALQAEKEKHDTAMANIAERKKAERGEEAGAKVAEYLRKIADAQKTLETATNADFIGQTNATISGYKALLDQAAKQQTDASAQAARTVRVELLLPSGRIASAMMPESEAAAFVEQLRLAGLRSTEAT